MRFKAWRSILKPFLLLSALFLTTLFIKKNVVSIQLVDGSSMVPTLNHRALVISLKKPLLHLLNRNLRRGDICIFEPSLDYRPYFIKRLVGLPNETLWLDDGRLFVGGKIESTWDRPELSGLGTPITCRYTEKYSIPTDNYFFMGDNRCNSFDSRQVGPIQKDFIQGLVVAVLFKGFEN